MNTHRLLSYAFYIILLIYVVLWILVIFFKDLFLLFMESMPLDFALLIILTMTVMAPIIIVVAFVKIFIFLRDYTSRVLEPHIKLIISNKEYRLSFVSGLLVGLIFLGITFLMDMIEYILYEISILYKVSLYQFKFIKYLAGLIVLIYLLGMFNRYLNVEDEE